jgi:hypothetical protein
MDSVITLEADVYSGPSLAREIASKINDLYRKTLVVEKLFSEYLSDARDLTTYGLLQVTYDPVLNKIVFSTSQTNSGAKNYPQIRFFTDDQMKQMRVDLDIFKNPTYNVQQVNNMTVFGANFDKDNLCSANAIIGNKYNSRIGGVDLVASSVNFEDDSKRVYYEWSTGFLNLIRHTNLYLCSDDLTSFRTIGPNGDSSILKKIPVTVNFGSIIVSETVLPGDYIELGSKTMRQLSFRLLGTDGQVVNLNGGEISFSLVFNKA